MKNYKIGVSLEMHGYVNIEAESLEEAMKIAEQNLAIELVDGSYVHGSWEVDYEKTYTINKEE